MWRKRCHDNLRRARRKLENGMHIRFDKPIHFNDGHEGRDFIVHKRGRRVELARPGQAFASYSIRHLSTAPWVEVPHARVHKATFA